MIVLFPKKRATITLRHGADGQWYFRAKAPNNEIVFQSEGYTRREDAERAAIAMTETKFTYEDN